MYIKSAMVNTIIVVKQNAIIIIHKYVQYLFMKAVNSMYLTPFINNLKIETPVCQEVMYKFDYFQE